MKLSAPKQTVWMAALIVGVLGVLGNFVTIPFVTANAFWFVTVGFAVLVLGTAFKGA
jgi:hypothetical protein